MSDYGATPENEAPFQLQTLRPNSRRFCWSFVHSSRTRKTRQKRWLCLFTCLETLAAHLEMAWGLDTDTFLNAFAHFTSRHGVPEEVISDRGTNFVGAVGEITKLTSQLDRRHLQCKTAELGLTWRFNPPGDSARYSKRTLAVRTNC